MSRDWEIILAKASIYLRTSTREQFPEKQKVECLEFIKERGYELEGVYTEQLSGYKQIERPEYEKLKEKARRGEIKAIVVWALDRWVRNRDTLLEDVTILRNYGVKLHSVKEAWLEAINIEGSLGKTIQDFLLGLIGSLAQMESQRKSERTKMAYDNRKGIWGRRNLPEETQKAIIEAFKQGRSYSKICLEVFYWDKNRNKKFVSKGIVHKVITDFKLNSNRKEGVQV